VRCRVCDSVATLCAQSRDVFFYRCQVCGFLSGKPARWIEPDQYYESYHYGPAPPAPEARYIEWLSRQKLPLARAACWKSVQEQGGFVRVARARGWRVDATETSKSGVEAPLGSGATVFAGDVLAANCPDKVFDMVVSFEVLEHLSAPLRYLREFCHASWRSASSDNTKLQWAVASVSWRPVARHRPEHLGYFTPATQSHALREAGYLGVTGLGDSLWA
jgi:hypothetical protein